MFAHKSDHGAWVIVVFAMVYVLFVVMFYQVSVLSSICLYDARGYHRVIVEDGSVCEEIAIVKCQKGKACT